MTYSMKRGRKVSTESRGQLVGIMSDMKRDRDRLESRLATAANLLQKDYWKLEDLKFISQCREQKLRGELRVDLVIERSTGVPVLWMGTLQIKKYSKNAQTFVGKPLDDARLIVQVLTTIGVKWTLEYVDRDGRSEYLSSDVDS